MTARAHRAAQQSDPEFNTQWKRWLPDGATGPDPSPVRTWHADDAPPRLKLSAPRRAAERAWARITATPAA